MSASLARFLKDFSEPTPPPAMPGESVFDFSATSAPEFDLPPEPEIDLEEERREAFEEGRMAMRSELEAQHAEEIEALSQAQAAAEEELKARLEAEMASQLAAKMAEMEQRILEQLSAGVINTLMPILDEQMAKQAVDALADTIKSAFHDEEGVELVLRGPQSLATPLEEALGAAGFKLRFVETDDLDITVEKEETVFMTRLSAWSHSVEELLK